MRKLRLNNMPGVVAWLQLLRDSGPQRRSSGRAGASAQNYGLTDYWVKDIFTGREQHLAVFREAHKDDPHWYRKIDFQDGLEAITPKGIKILDEAGL